MNGNVWRVGAVLGWMAIAGGAVADDATQAPAANVPAQAVKAAQAPRTDLAPVADPAALKVAHAAETVNVSTTATTPSAKPLAKPTKDAIGSINGTVAIGTAKPVDYPDLAKIQLQYAIRAAMNKVQGKLLKVELEAANGFLVWEVEIVKSDKSVFAVKVDAGTGAVLAVERDEPGSGGE